MNKVTTTIKIMSWLIITLLILFFITFTGCITRDGEILGRNNPIDPFNTRSKILLTDTIWNSFNQVDSTGTIKCSIGVETSFFRLVVYQDSLQTVYSGNTNSFLITHLHPGSEKRYSLIVYINQTDSLVDTGYIEAPAGTPPTAPQNPVATGTLSGITLYWTGTKHIGETVNIYKADSLNGKFIQIATRTDTAFTDTANDFIQHYYIIASRNKYGETQCPTIVSARKLVNYPPPQNVVISESVIDSTLKISWKPVSGISSYYIFKSGSRDASFYEFGRSNNSSFTFKSVPGDTAYYKIAIMVQGDKCGLLSDAIMGYISAPLTAPENIIASQGTYDNYIKITWQPVHGASKYIIYRSAMQSTLSNTDSTKDTFYIDSVKSTSVFYYAVSSNGNNGYVSEKSKTVSGYLKPVPPPIGLEATDGTNNRFILLSWEPYAGSIRFNVYRSKNPDSIFTLLGTSILPEYDDTIANTQVWYYKVSSVNQKGIESELSTYDSGYRKGLNAPTNLRISQGEHPLFVDITWGPVTDASYYKVYRSIPPYSSFKQIGVSISAAYIDSSCDTSSYYRVSAVDSYGVEGGMSATVLGYPGALGITPRISASNNRPKSISVSWDSVELAEKYIVYRSLTISNFYAIDTVADESYSDTTATKAYYKVAIIYRTRTGPLSSYAYGIKLSSPSSVQLTADSAMIRLSWTVVSGALRYRIYRSTDNVTFTALDTTSNLTYTDTHMKKDIFYYYKITSMSPYGESTPGESTQGIVLSAPIGLKSTISHDTILMQWDAVQYATSYQFYVKTVSDSNYATPFITSNTSLRVIASETGIYKFRVKAVSGSNVSGFSKFDSCYAKARPHTPVNFQVFSNPGFIRLSWRPDLTGEKPDSYIVYRSSTSYGIYTEIDTTTDTTFTDTIKQSGDRYYKVSSLNSSGVSPQTSGLRGTSQVLQAPVSVMVSTLYGTHIEAKWNRVSGAQQYIVYRSKTLQNFTAADTVTDTIYRDSTCEPGTAYYFAVASLGIPGTSTQTISNTSGMRLPAPSAVTATGSAAFILIHWPKVQNATTYSVYKANTSTGTYTRIANVVDTIYRDSVKTSGAFYYKVSSSNLSESPLSNSNDSAKLQFPASPVTVSASKGTLDDAVQITWSKSEGAIQYLIYRSSSILFEDVTFIDSTSTTQINDTVPSDSVYYYLVKSAGYAGESAPGPTASGYRVPLIIPLPPENLSATSSPLFIHLTWDAPQSTIPVTGYKIYRSESAAGTYAIIDSTTETGYDDYVPKSFPTYYWYKITSYNLQGNSLPSDTIKATRN